MTCSIGKWLGLLKYKEWDKRGGGRSGGADHIPAGFLTCEMKSAEGNTSAGVFVEKWNDVKHLPISAGETHLYLEDD